MLRFLVLLSALLAAPALASGETWGWVTANGKDLCAGIITDCNTAETCTTVGVGPCEGDATAPTAYLKSNLVGLALVKEATYLADSNDLTEIEPSGLGYRDFKKEIDYTDPEDNTKTTKYAYTMSGNIFGGKGYAGVASYLLTGAGDIRTQHNNFYVALNANDTARVDRSSSDSESTIGAPAGPYKVCISKYDDADTDKCGAARTFKTGDYKFSIFGHIFDTIDFAGRDHLGFRMKLSTVGFKVEEVKVNGATWSAAKQSDNADTLELVHDSGTLKFDFPTDYNVGTTAGAVAGGSQMTVTAGKTVKIKVHSVSSTDQSLLIDYLFETASMGVGKYFTYDPTIKESKTVQATTAAPPATTPAPSSAPGTSVARVTLAVGVMAAVFGSI